jgi:CDP-glucose 4,6-dehydratase
VEDVVGMTWANRRVLVTGATGMVGSWLTRRLVDEGALVVALVLDADPQSELLRSGTMERVSVVNGDLRDAATVERAIAGPEVDTVIHLGAQTIVGTAHRSPRATLETNVLGTWNVLDACRIHSDLVERIVVASSDKAYGSQTTLPYTEETPLAGRQPYEVSKSAADLITQAYAHSYDLPVAIARCGNVYGGGDLNWSRIVPGTIRSLLRGETPVLRSDGTLIRDYLHVDDVVTAYLTLADAAAHNDARGRAFNFSDEDPVSVLDLYTEICDAVGGGRVEPEILGDSSGEIDRQHLDASRARKVLDWEPRIDRPQGLRTTVDWYRLLVGR